MTANNPLTEESVQDFIAEVDTGARAPTGHFSRNVLFYVPMAWSLFQLWIASPLPYLLADYIPLMNDTHTRAIHLAFAIFLAYLSYPALKRSPRDRIPFQDWALALIGAFAACYIAIFAVALSTRPGLPITADLVAAGVGMVCLLEATRRSLGPPLLLVALLFLSYVFFGHLAPDVIAWKGASFTKAMSHQWLTQEGVFGIGLGVSTTFVFLFVLFGALLDKAGAGNYFTMVAFSLLGHLRGGPAKAAVVSSAMNGMISGSSIANVVVTGTFTIPLMKRVGFPAEKAGAIEVASSTNGQLMPPIMGAAAFLMIEYVGISYVEVIRHAFLPAVISYIALIYIVHLEACKAGMEGLPRRTVTPLMQRIFGLVITLLGMVILSGVIYFGFSWVKDVAGDASAWIAGAVILAAYFFLMRIAASVPDLGDEAAITKMEYLPETGPTIKSGLHFLLPVVVLIWCLVVERFSPGLAAYWASLLMIFVVVTQDIVKNFFRGGSPDYANALRSGLRHTADGLVFGARNMIGIGIATAVAGIVVGTVTLTGIGLVMTEFVEFISGGNLILMLLFTAFISLLLGMGLPTTANYIVVSTLMAPVIVTLGAEQGLIVPLIAVHMFVFYFGILADDTPPVGLAAFAAAAISRGDPIRTGIQGFMYDIRTAILPFMFIFNTELLLIGIESVWHLILVVTAAVAAMLLFAAGTQGYFLVRSKLWESLAMILIAFTLFRPGFWMDMVSPPLETRPPQDIMAIAEKQDPDAFLRVTMSGETIDGDFVTRIVPLPLGPAASGPERLSHAGVEIREDGGKVLVDNIVFGTAAEKAGVDFDWEIIDVQAEADQPPKYLFYVPALLLFVVIVVTQRRRKAALAPA
ncbi:MAG: TRAP transporter permease [Alphaproteobacteria bacterium]|nr:TRAP transporter permease [Alphaproteobacteria bacterium]